MSGLGGHSFEQLTADVDGLYHSCCNHLPAVGAISLSAEGDAFLADLIQQIFDERSIPENSPDLVRAYGSKLGDAVVKGYGALDAFDWDSPDYAAVAQLQNNVWQFSAAKTHTQLRDMGKALVGPDGKIRSFQEYKIEAERIAGQQLRWLKVEYDTALACAQMAAMWEEIQRDKETFPFLEFDAVLDENSSEICPPLDKIVLPVDHPWWLIYYPPNHYGCRSRVRKLRTGKVTPDDQLPYPQIPPLFKGNVGVTGLVFPTDHAYYVDAPAHIVKNATLYMPGNDQYLTIYQAKDDTPVKANRKTLLENGEDLPNLKKAAEVLADKGKAVDILPAINAAETELRETLLPGVKPGKNPDMIVDNEYTEVKAPTAPVTYKKLQRNIANAAQQADRVIVVLEEEYDVAVLKAAALDRFKAVPELEEIGFVTVDGEYIEFINDLGR